MHKSDQIHNLSYTVSDINGDKNWDSWFVTVDQGLNVRLF